MKTPRQRPECNVYCTIEQSLVEIGISIDERRGPSVRRAPIGRREGSEGQVVRFFL